MAFETPITILEAIENIQKNKYLLPAIQREFVWKIEQIEKLFDSLMNDYPIGSFLFWRVENVSDYRFYKFIQKYNEKGTNHNEVINLIENRETIAILDGQQRLTALYIGLLGSYAEKIPYYRRDNPNAFPEKYLCLNLLEEIEDGDKKYNFKFCTDKEIDKKSQNSYWFKVNNILKINGPEEITEYAMDVFQEEVDKEIYKLVHKKLHKLYEVIHRTSIINFYLEKQNDLDKVLNIFIRTNSAGTKLNYSDLLLSIATAQWNEKDAREEIYKAVDELNSIGNKFNLDKDFILKACLFLTQEIKNIKFQINNFKKENMELIEKNWVNIYNSLHYSLELVSSLGYSRETLSSNSVILVIALYLLKNKIGEEIITSSRYHNDRKLIKEWIIKSTLRRIFSGTENVLKVIREVIIENNRGEFPLDEIKEKLKGIPNRSITFTEEDVEVFMEYTYGDTYTFSILQLLYPSLDYRNIFHIDHIFPKAKFNKKYLSSLGLDIDELYNPNYIANLQLLEGTQNKEKSDKEFLIWLNEQNYSEEEKKEYFKKNYIPDTILNFENYNDFFEKRENLLISKLKELLI